MHFPDIGVVNKSKKCLHSDVMEFSEDSNFESIYELELVTFKWKQTDRGGMCVTLSM